MSVLDALFELSDAQSVIIGSGTTIDGESVVDLGPSGKDGLGNAQTPDIGRGNRLILNVQVATTLVGAGGTVACVLQHDTAVGMGTAATLVTVGTFAALAAAGTKLSIALPSGTVNRYLRMLYTSGAAITAGDIDAWIGLDREVGQ